MGLLNRLEVSGEGDGSRFLDNEDLRATPPEKRTWDFKFYCLFWLAAVTNVSLALCARPYRKCRQWPAGLTTPRSGCSC